MSRKTSAYARKRRAHGPQRMDSITAGRLYITHLTPAERARVLDRLPQIRARLLTVAYSYADFVELSTVKHRSQAANDIGLVRDLQGVLPTAHQVLDQLGREAERTPGQWHPRALRSTELLAIDDLLALYRCVVGEVTYGEWVRIEDLSVARVRTEGGAVFNGPAQQRAAP